MYFDIVSSAHFLEISQFVLEWLYLNNTDTKEGGFTEAEISNILYNIWNDHYCPAQWAYFLSPIVIFLHLCYNSVPWSDFQEHVTDSINLDWHSTIILVSVQALPGMTKKQNIAQQLLCWHVYFEKRQPYWVVTLLENSENSIFENVLKSLQYLTCFCHRTIISS